MVAESSACTMTSAQRGETRAARRISSVERKHRRSAAKGHPVAEQSAALSKNQQEMVRNMLARLVSTTLREDKPPTLTMRRALGSKRLASISEQQTDASERDPFILTRSLPLSSVVAAQRRSPSRNTFSNEKVAILGKSSRLKSPKCTGIIEPVDDDSTGYDDKSHNIIVTSYGRPHISPRIPKFHLQSQCLHTPLAVGDDSFVDSKELCALSHDVLLKRCEEGKDDKRDDTRPISRQSPKDSFTYITPALLVSLSVPIEHLSREYRKLAVRQQKHEPLYCSKQASYHGQHLLKANKEHRTTQEQQEQSDNMELEQLEADRVPSTWLPLLILKPALKTQSSIQVSQMSKPESRNVRFCSVESAQVTSSTCRTRKSSASISATDEDKGAPMVRLWDVKFRSSSADATELSS